MPEESSYVKPIVGVTYKPATLVVPISDGLPRTVDSIATRRNTDRFVVHFTTDDGKGFQSDNLWCRWVEQTDAKPSS